MFFFYLKSEVSAIRKILIFPGFVRGYGGKFSGPSVKDYDLQLINVSLCHVISLDLNALDEHAFSNLIIPPGK